MALAGGQVIQKGEAPSPTGSAAAAGRPSFTVRKVRYVCGPSVRSMRTPCAGSSERTIAMPHHPLKLHVLVVEDDLDTAQSFATILKLWGHLASVATEPANALRLAEQARPDVIFLDIGLPQMDG